MRQSRYCPIRDRVILFCILADSGYEEIAHVTDEFLSLFDFDSRETLLRISTCDAFSTS